MTEPVVALCVDKNLIEHVRPVFNSVMRNTGCVDVYVLCDAGVSEADLRRLPSQAKVIRDIDIPSIDVGRFMPSHKYWSQHPAITRDPVCARLYEHKAMYYRWLLPDLIGAEKVFYAECDMIITGDLHELFAIDMGENYIAAVPTAHRLTMTRVWQQEAMVALPEGIDLSGICYASGQLVINSALWRRDRLGEQLISLVERIAMFDMLALNIVCRNRIMELDRSWMVPANRMIGDLLPFTGERYSKKNLYHWYGRQKPWAQRCHFQRVYDAYR